jgi:carbamoyl-phosphate synthase small subunit
MTREAILALEDGRTFRGLAWGALAERTGEIVFNTAMTGYQEILTDPSYAGQIVTMTYPEIGNYGVNAEDVESRRPFVEGFVVRELSQVVSNWRASTSLDEYLKRHGIVGIAEIDTRALVRHIREKGAMRACVSSVDSDERSVVEKARSAPEMLGRNLVDEVTCDDPYRWAEIEDGGSKVEDRMDDAALGPRTSTLDPVGEFRRHRQSLLLPGEEPFRVVAFDFGVKYYILRYLAAVGCDVTVVPARTSADDVISLAPDGVFLSNGPGDPAALSEIVADLRHLSRTPIARAGVRRRNLQTQIRPPRRQSACQKHAQRPHRDYLSQPRFRRRSGQPEPERHRAYAFQPQRRLPRRNAPQKSARLFSPVSS